MATPGLNIEFFLRQSESGGGPIIAALNDQVLTFNALTGKWRGANVPAPPSELFNLSDVVYVDNGTVAPGLDGNIESPFLTFEDGANSGAQTVFVTPLNYLAEGTVVVSAAGHGLNVIGLGLFSQSLISALQMPLLPVLDLAPGPGPWDFNFENVRVQFDGANANVFRIGLRNCYGIANNDSIPATYVVEGGLFEGDVGSGGIQANGTEFQLGLSLITGSTCVLRNCTFVGPVPIDFDVAGGVLQVDLLTYQNMLAQGVTVVNGSIITLDLFGFLQFGSGNVLPSGFAGAWGQIGNMSTTLSLPRQISPLRRIVITQIRGRLDAAAVNAVTFTIYVNGVSTGQGVTIPVAGTNVAATVSVEVQAEDLVAVFTTVAATQSTSCSQELDYGQ
jgi:hypothetical protein